MFVCMVLPPPLPLIPFGNLNLNGSTACMTVVGGAFGQSHACLSLNKLCGLTQCTGAASHVGMQAVTQPLG